MIALRSPVPAATTRLFHAPSDETRLATLRQLGSGERCVCELTGALDAAQSRLSFHCSCAFVRATRLAER